MCPDGFVYDLEIEDNHNYLAENILVHNCGSYPKPCQKAKILRDLISGDVIFLSGTPTPESTSQIFHQLWVLKSKSPFYNYKNFYQWAKDYCNIKERSFGYGIVKDYSDCHFDINKLDFITYSQKDAGFVSEKKEHFCEVKMLQSTKNLIKIIKKDKVYTSHENTILADTGVKEMQKIHQISSGTVITEEGKSIVFDYSKVDFIRENFNKKKLAIFYKFKGELKALKERLNITESIDEFNNSNKHIALQFVSGREGIKLDKADCIIAYNIDFSATTYFQFRERMITIDRLKSDIYWLFSDCGIEKQIYKVVNQKKNFTLKYYERAANTI